MIENESEWFLHFKFVKQRWIYVFLIEPIRQKICRMVFHSLIISILNVMSINKMRNTGYIDIEYNFYSKNILHWCFTLKTQSVVLFGQYISKAR